MDLATTRSPVESDPEGDALALRSRSSITAGSSIVGSPFVAIHDRLLDGRVADPGFDGGEERSQTEGQSACTGHESDIDTDSYPDTYSYL